MEVIVGRYISRRIFSAAGHLYKIAVTPCQEKHIIPSSPSSGLLSASGFRPLFFSQKASADMPTVDYDYVRRATSQKDILIIDVREPDEVKEHGKIQNSLNIPLGSISTTLALSDEEFQKKFGQAKPKLDTEIILYCMIGKRSGKAQQSAMSLGFKNAKNYMGSWTDWAEKTK